MERRDLEIFLILAEELHFGRTAERLHVSTAMVSQTIKSIERRIGVPLFERTSRRVALTPVGRRLEEDVRPAFLQIEEGIARAVAAGRGVTGTLRVGFVGTAIGQFVIGVADRFSARHPECEVRIIENRYADGTSQLHADEIDLLLAGAPSLEDDLAESPVLFRESPVLAVSARHPFARRESVAMADLTRDQVLMPRSLSQEVDELVVPPLEGLRRGPSFSTIQEMLALIGAGKGVFPVPAHAVHYDSRPDVAYVPIRDGQPFAWRLIWRATAESARIRAFVQAAEDAVKDDPSPLIP
ncbi:LysR family transcriptional regulator [Nonomuraea jabiensis]|uniref:DNA-binding transcriptional LysR family regulator n=1 Tax=Nonomuraea jabiensis TaxID=882448 RepID=A0A7W9G6Z4_9ACTN|nr:LysR family transcriptional regulator [Nonomuraea jabiensis]MBB5778251.1 DNA-binding transcriptional LysR family regulator [Nonomuraea jabiensis]